MKWHTKGQKTLGMPFCAFAGRQFIYIDIITGVYAHLRHIPRKEPIVAKRFQLLNNRNLNPTRFVFFGFLVVILLGAFLLWLPISSNSREFTSPLVCLFTATSATCVTGLVQVDTAIHWTLFGQIVIIILIQMGGLGFVTLIAMVALMFRQRIGLGQRMIMASAFNLNGTAGVVRMVRHALIGTFALEMIGAVILATQFIPIFGIAKGIWYGIFHSISAFCNAGFDLFGEYSGSYSSLTAFQNSPVVLGTIMCLIVLGGLGFFVWEDVYTKRNWKKLSLYSKLVLKITAILIIGGWIFFLMMESTNPQLFGGMNTLDQQMNALFQSITLRTAGFATVDQGALSEGSQVMSMLLMLVGGSSGSAAGGMKTVTVGILLFALRDGMRGRDQVVIDGRSIPANRILNAMTLALVMLSTFIIMSIALVVVDDLSFVAAAFEVASAMATVGLSVGITPDLSVVSTLLITMLMFLGRVGILSFSIAFLTQKRKGNLMHYPPVDILVG